VTVLYPSGLSTAYDFELHDLIESAFLGDTKTTVLVERGADGDYQWNVTAAPLMSSSGEIVGVIVYLTALAQRVEREMILQVTKRPEAETQVDLEKMRREFAEKLDSMQTEFLNAIPRMFFVVDDEARCIYANAHFLNALKLGRDAVVGRLFTELALENDPLNEGLPERFLRAIRENSSEDLECKLSTKDGEVLSLGLKNVRLQWKNESHGTTPLTLISCVDNTKLRRTEEQLKRISTTDVSTGALNRQGMERVLGEEVERAVRYRGSLALIILDVDGFRHLNEQIGYAASDHILKELTAALKSRIRLTDFLGRWSGDEFMILTPLPLAMAYQLAEKLRDMTEHNTFGEGNALTLSAGVAEYCKSMDIFAFVAAAYDAMTEAKRGGGNRTVQALKTKDASEEATE
jgi:diguanylate cyclase (GGDEF)-like protein/PAS domain S-box-containing protein